MKYEKLKLEIGDRIGRLTIIGPIVTKNGKTSYSPCRCDCGKEWLAHRTGIREGRTRSCGCLGKEIRKAANTKHGMRPRGRSAPEYTAWYSMIQRCTNPKSTAYHYYGGRGITVYREWLTFENFYRDMGPRPQKTTIERLNNAEGYKPGNCVWATRTQQMRNTRGNRFVNYNGEKLCVREACSKAGIPERRVYWWTHKHRVTHQEAFDKYLHALLSGQTGHV